MTLTQALYRIPNYRYSRLMSPIAAYPGRLVLQICSQETGPGRFCSDPASRLTTSAAFMKMMYLGDVDRDRYGLPQ